MLLLYYYYEVNISVHLQPNLNNFVQNRHKILQKYFEGCGYAPLWITQPGITVEWDGLYLYLQMRLCLF